MAKPFGAFRPELPSARTDRAKKGIVTISRLSLATSIIFIFSTLAVGDASVKQMERTLTDVIRAGDRATIAIGTTRNHLSYCSHALGICASYLIDTGRNWQRLKSSLCDGTGTDEKALLTFVGKDGPQPSISGPRNLVIDPDGLQGRPSAGPLATWTTALSLGTRAAILEDYRKLNPVELGSLRAWLLERERNAGYRSIRIACFKPTDPEVFLYGDRSPGSGLVFSVFWNRDEDDWAEVAILRAPELPKRFEEVKSRVEALSCGTVDFK
jgi:hypothetical protein